MKWTDSREIAIALADKHPDIDPQRINFVDLRQWVLEPTASTTIRRTPARRSSKRSRPTGSTNLTSTTRTEPRVRRNGADGGQ